MNEIERSNLDEEERRFVDDFFATFLIANEETYYMVIDCIKRWTKEEEARSIHEEKLRKVLPYVRGTRLIPFQRYVKAWLHKPDGPIGKRTIANLRKIND